MRTLLALLASLAALPAQQIPVVNGDGLFAPQKALAPHVWMLHGKPHSIGAVLQQPAARVALTRPVEIPVRGSLIGASPHVRDHLYLFPEKDFKGDWLVQIEEDKTPEQANDLFSQHVANLELHCRGKADGITWGGAQGSTFGNVRVVHPRETGVHIQVGSRAGAFHGVLEVKGHPDHAGKSHGTGFRLSGLAGWYGGTFHLHQCDLGMRLWRCSGLDFGVVSEHTVLPLRLDQCSNLRIRGEFRTTGDLLVDLTGSWGGIEIAGRVNKSVDKVYYLDRDGERRLLGTGGHTENGFTFKIQTD